MYAYLLLHFYIIWSALCFVMEGIENGTKSFPFWQDIHSNISHRIIGGVKVAPDSYPFLAALTIFNGTYLFMCGGSLISSRWILTAAHCVSMKPHYITIELGNAHEDFTKVIVKSKNYIIHEDWNGTSHENDVALVKLPHDLIFTEYIKPVPLASSFDEYNGTAAVAMGRGMTETDFESSDVLDVNITIMTNDECSKIDEDYKKIIKPMHLCTSGEGIVGTCNGDSGGPLLVNGVQVAIAAFGSRNCTEGKPSVFTRVAVFHNWILTHTSEVCTTIQEKKSIYFAATMFIIFCFIIYYMAKQIIEKRNIISNNSGITEEP